MNPQQYSIQFYRRNDGSSISYIGERVCNSLIEAGFNVNFWGIDKPIEGQKIGVADLAILYGIPRDLKLLTRHRDKIGGLVCEYDLTDKEAQLIKNANLNEVWVPSSQCIKLFQKAGVENLVLVSHGTDSAPKVYKNFEKEFCFLMIFNSYIRLNEHVKRKGIFEVLEAFKKVRQEHKDARLILRTKKQNYYNGIDLTGVEFLEQRLDINELYSKAHCVLSPSYAEGFGLIGLESLIRGIPLISTKTGNDYLSDDIHYLPLPTPFDSDLLGLTMFEVMKFYEQHKAQSLAQCDLINDRYNWIKISEGIVTRVRNYFLNRWGR